MLKTWRVAWHQFRREVFTRGFAIGFLIGPPFTFLAFALVQGLVVYLMGTQATALTQTMLGRIVPLSQPATGAVGYVDSAQLITVWQDDIPRARFISFADESAARRALDEQRIVGYYIIPTDVTTVLQLNYYSDRPVPLDTDTQLSELLKFNLTKPLDPLRVQRIRNDWNLETVILEPDTNVPPPPSDDDLQNEITLAWSIGGLFFTVINMNGVILLAQLTREKIGRVLEVLLGAVSHEQLIAGKFISALTVSFVQMLLWLGWVQLFTGLSAVPAQWFTPDFGAVVLVFIAGVITFAAMMTATATFVDTIEDSATLTLLFASITFLPLIWGSALIKQPNGILAIVFSFIPITAPTTLILRLFLAPVPAYQVAAGLFALGLWDGLLLWLAVRLFRARSLHRGDSKWLREVNWKKYGLIGNALVLVATWLYFFLADTARNNSLTFLIAFLSLCACFIFSLAFANRLATRRALLALGAIHLLAQFWLQWQWQFWLTPQRNINMGILLIALDSLFLCGAHFFINLRHPPNARTLALTWSSLLVFALALALYIERIPYPNSLFFGSFALLMVPWFLLVLLAVSQLTLYFGHAVLRHLHIVGD